MTSKLTAAQRLKQYMPGLLEVNCNVKSKESNVTVHKSLNPLSVLLKRNSRTLIYSISAFFSLFAARWLAQRVGRGVRVGHAAHIQTDVHTDTIQALINEGQRVENTEVRCAEGY